MILDSHYAGSNSFVRSFSNAAWRALVIVASLLGRQNSLFDHRKFPFCCIGNLAIRRSASIARWPARLRSIQQQFG